MSARAPVLLRLGRPTAATRLLGATDALSEATGMVLTLGAGAFAAAWEAGRVLRLKTVVAEALALVDELADTTAD